MNVVTEVDEDYAKLIEQSENVKSDVERFADGLIKTINAKKQNMIAAIERQTKKSLETMFEGVDQTVPIAHDPEPALVFVENKKMHGIVNGEEIGSLEVLFHTKGSQSLAEGEGLKEGNVGRKAQFDLITRNAERRQGYDKHVKLAFKFTYEQGQGWVTEVQRKDNENGVYNMSYIPSVQGKLQISIEVNGEHVGGSPFTVLVKPAFHVKPVLSFGKLGWQQDGMFQHPSGVAVNDRDEIVVADDIDRIQIFNSDGSFVKSFGPYGQNKKQFSNPNGIAVDNDRTIFVAELGKHRVQILSWEGRHLGSFGGKGSLDSQLTNPWGLSLDTDGNVIVADTGNKLIKIFSREGRFLMKIGGQGSFSDPVHCVQCADYLIVSDYTEHCIKVYSGEGKFQHQFGKKGEGDGEFNNPCFLSVTKSKHLLVCDSGNDRVQVFELNGKFVEKFGTKGDKLGELNGPWAVAILSNDKIVVTDSRNHRIQIFQ